MRAAESVEGILPPTRPDRLLGITKDQRPPQEEHERAYRVRRRKRCDEIHEADRILRAKSSLGVLCVPAEGQILGPQQIGLKYEAALRRLDKAERRPDVLRVQQAKRRLETARQRMMNPAVQRMERDKYREQRWEVTNRMCVPIDVKGLEEFAATEAAKVVPVRNRRPDNKDSYKVMIENLLRNVKRPHAGSRFGWVNVEYEYKPQGRALVDAGLITSAREYAIPPHYYNDPFTMKKELRGIALGWGHDIDDVAAHPYAKLAIVPAGRDITKLYLSNRDQIMKAQGDKWFPHLSNIKERRDKVKKLYNAMNNDGFTANGGRTRGCGRADGRFECRALASNNGTFGLKEYVAEMKNGTECWRTSCASIGLCRS